MRKILGAIAALFWTTSLQAVTIAPGDALSPEEQQKRFKLPKGFVIELVVAEPEIGQPMNLNFDARGRLWVSSSVEYPYPAKGDIDEPAGKFNKFSDHPPGDWLTVVSDLDHSGRAQTVKRFATGLNIPIGTLPLGDGSSVLAYDIPSIRRHHDHDGDGIADKSHIVYTRFGHRDTHGMSSSFTRWADGWVYGCHGFANTSRIRDGRGVTTELYSGSTYRFRADGSHFEQFTRGQINPYGITFDALGNIYNADCHSMPVYMLLRGATYLRPTWGKPYNDPLGTAPAMIDHNHGSTGICGPVIYDAPQFPANYRDSLFLCNPVTGKVHWDKLKDQGSSRFVETQPDLISCADQWFRPVDAALGPDGALYIADFYNAIIGHYEVELEHKKRDRTHGRVWRIRYQGEQNKPLLLPDLTKKQLPELINSLGDPNITTRNLALNYLVDHHGKAGVPGIKKAIAKGNSRLIAQCMWALERIEIIEEEMLGKLARAQDRLPRIFTMKILAERTSLSVFEQDLVLEGLQDSDPTTRRCAADALTHHLLPHSIQPLFAAWEEADKKDTHLIHVIRMALRCQLESIDNWDKLNRQLPNTAGKRLASMAAVVGNEKAVTFAAARISVTGIAKLAATDTEQLLSYCKMIRKMPQESASAFIERLRAANLDLPLQARVLLSLNGHKTAAGWAANLAAKMLESRYDDVWQPLAPSAPESTPWVTQERKSEDNQDALFWSSLPRGEKLTGILQSPPFKAPEKLTFFMAGHDNHPDQPLGSANYVCLLDHSTGKELMRVRPPRHDTAKKITWNLAPHKAREVKLELVDGNPGSGFAWLAVGRFAPAVIGVGTRDQRDVGIQLAHAFELRNMRDALGKILSDTSTRTSLRTQAGKTLLGWSPRHPQEVITKMKSAPAPMQQQLAKSVTRNREGSGALLEAIEQGRLSAHLLQDKQLVEQIKALKPMNADRRLQQLMALLPPTDAGLKKLMDRRRAAYFTKPGNPENGQVVFSTYCASCHQIGGKGAGIGPSLDGIGNRGIDRLLEDVLDPDRNIDPAFAMTMITTKKGNVISGIGAREEGDNIEVTDASGKLRIIGRKDVAQRSISGLSLMPSALSRAIPDQEFVDLMRYLLNQK
jgi:putative membrane-bound dehydrogenase-like protein